MVKTHNRIIAGVLSTLMVGQVAFFGDGTTKGIRNIAKNSVISASKVTSAWSGIKVAWNELTKKK